MKPTGYIKTAPHSTATTVPGVFAAGDVKDEYTARPSPPPGMGCMAALKPNVSSLHSREATAPRPNEYRSLPPKRQREKVRNGLGQAAVFHAAAEAGSFTHAGEHWPVAVGGVAQVSALEQEIRSRCFTAMPAA